MGYTYVGFKASAPTEQVCVGRRAAFQRVFASEFVGRQVIKLL